MIGPPVESGGVTAWFHVKERLLVDRVHVAPVAGGNGETFPKLVPHLFVPANDATLSSTAVLDALVTGYFKVTKVEFYLTGASQHDTLIGTGENNPLRIGDTVEYDHRGQRHVHPSERRLRRCR